MNMSFFNIIEYKYDLNHIEINGCNFWVYYREKIARQIDSKYYQYEYPNHERLKDKNKSRVKNFIVRSVRSFAGEKIPYKHYDILFLSNGRRYYNGENYESPILDIVMKEFDNSIMYERIYSETDKYDSIMTNNIYMNYEKHKLHEVIVFKIKKIALYNRYYSLLINILKKPLEELERGYGVKIDFPYDEVINKILYHKMDRRMVQRIINRVTPKIIVEECYYSTNQLLFNEIAYDKNIPVVEMQHGTAGKEHQAYQFNLEGEVIKQLPTYFFAFSDFWISRMNFPVKSFSVGCPYKEREVNKYKVSGLRDRNIVLFLSDGYYTGIKRSKFAVELHKKLKESRYRLVYKLHPQEYLTWKGDYPWLVESGVEVVDSSKTSLYELFSESVVQVIGGNSTAVYEGLMFGLLTFVDLNYAYSEFIELCEQKNFYGFNTIEELLEGLYIVEDEEKEYDIDYFWKQNALSNIKREISKIIVNEEIN